LVDFPRGRVHRINMRPPPFYFQLKLLPLRYANSVSFVIELKFSIPQPAYCHT
jgi:hypothetical protein